jgi:hypothetical protein
MEMQEAIEKATRLTNEYKQNLYDQRIAARDDDLIRIYVNLRDIFCPKKEPVKTR